MYAKPQNLNDLDTHWYYKYYDIILIKLIYKLKTTIWIINDYSSFEVSFIDKKAWDNFIHHCNLA